jgi:hypothetical protein
VHWAHGESRGFLDIYGYLRILMVMFTDACQITPEVMSLMAPMAVIFEQLSV